MVASIFGDSYAELQPLIAPLRCDDIPDGPESGFRNVYRISAKSRDGGVARWRAKVKVKGLLTEIPGSRETEAWRCAVHVARWYERERGPHWARAFEARKKNPVMVKWSKKLRGFYARVWIEGKPHEVVKLTPKSVRDKQGRVPAGAFDPMQFWTRHPNELEIFPSAEAARHGAWLYAMCLLVPPAMRALYRAA